MKSSSLDNMLLHSVLALTSDGARKSLLSTPSNNSQTAQGSRTNAWKSKSSLPSAQNLLMSLHRAFKVHCVMGDGQGSGLESLGDLLRSWKLPQGLYARLERDRAYLLLMGWPYLLRMGSVRFDRSKLSPEDLTALAEDKEANQVALQRLQEVTVVSSDCKSLVGSSFAS